MTDKQLEAYYRYQRFIRITLTISGCWYMPTKSGKSIFFWPFCAFLLMITYAVLNFHKSYILRHNISIMMKCIILITSSCGSFFKVITFVTNRGTLIKYHQMLTDLFEEELMRNEKIRTIILSSLYKIRTLAYIYATILTALFLAYFLPPSLLIIRDLCRLRSPSTSYVLPITRGSGYFWVVPQNYLYHLHFLLEFTIWFVASSIATSVESAFGFYVYHFVSTMQAMTFRLTNPLPTEKYSDILKACVVKHQKLLKCRNTLEQVYGRIVFYHVISNAMSLCVLAYEMSIAEFHLNNLYTYLTYASVKLVQTFLYAFYGTLLTNAGEDFRQGIYFGEWHNSSLDRHMRTNVILMMMQKPLTTNAIFSTIGVVMLRNLVNTTMSYFFLLRSIDNDG